MHRLISLLKSLLLLMVSLALAAALAEAFLRIAPWQQLAPLKSGKWLSHQSRGYAMAPN